MSDARRGTGQPEPLRDAGLAWELLRRMLLMRRVEESVAEWIVAGEILCPCHLYIGQEAVAAGVCASLRPGDFVFSTHRSHGHYIAKGGDVAALIAEVFCRESGCSRGWGGSMHVCDASAGLPGSSAIVAGTIPLAVGAALAFATKGEDRVAAAFFGDGATNEGAFYESLNFAALRRLPVVFVCENNLYSTHMPIEKCLADTDIARKGAMFNMPAERVDGNDVLAVAAVSREAVECARGGGGPTLLECFTYRWRGHVGPNYDIEKGLRTREELESWMRRCPIQMLEKRMTADGMATAEALAQTRKSVAETVEQMVAAARAAPFPPEDGLLASSWPGAST